MGLLSELWGFARANRKYWLLPVFFIILLLTLLVIFTESSAVAPFIYTLF